MSTTRNLVLKLSQNEFNGVVSSLKKSEAYKTIDLIKFLRKNVLADQEIKEKLGLSKNAYYTLNSRLSERIEEFVITNSKNPRAILVSKATAINDILLTRNKTVALAALKKLEKELKAYDMTNELIQVYRALKKITINEPINFEYTQLYNRQLTLMVTMDKVEDSVVDYFRRYNENVTSFNTEEDFSYEIILDELANNFGVYGSHRMYVYYMLVNIFHSIFNKKSLDIEEIDDAFSKVERLFVNYQLDSSYQFLRWVFKYLRLLFYFKIDPQHRGIATLFDSLKAEQQRLASNGYLFTFVGYYFNILLKYSQAFPDEKILTDKDLDIIEDYDLSAQNLSNYYLMQGFVINAHLHFGNYQKAQQIIDKVFKQSKLKAYEELYIEYKLMQARCFGLLNQTAEKKKVLNSIVRLVRKVGKDKFTYGQIFFDYLNIDGTSLSEWNKRKRSLELAKEFNEIEKPLYSPLFAIQL